MSAQRRLSCIASIAALVIGCGPVRAHEYWLDPLDATPDVDGRLLVNVRNGEGFAGSSFPYDPRRMVHVALIGPDGARVLRGRLGDFPAVATMVGKAGLYLVTLETGPKALLYDDLAAFETFVDYHGARGVLKRHVERGLPDKDIRERYFRYAKTLVRAGSAAADPDKSTSTVFAAQGSLLELIPGNDPLDDDTLAVSLQFDGLPVADAQIELFRRSPENAVDRRVVRTDEAGRVRFDVSAPGDYMINAVRIVEPDEEPVGEDDGVLVSETAPPHWDSHWASLTFDRR